MKTATRRSNSSAKTISTQSLKTSKSPSRYSVGMFSAGEARCDRWQDLAHAAQTLVAQASSGSATKETLAAVETLLAPLSVIETFRAYPGEVMMSALKDALGRRDYSSFSRITNRIAKAIITGSYRRSASAWKLGEEGEAEGNDRLLKDYFDEGDLTKPYFEVLIVSDDPTPEQVRQGRVELRQLRRPEDPFVYEAVTVPSFEEGVLGVVMNADLQAVIIKDNFRFKSQFDAPLLRTYLEQHLSQECGSLEPKDYGVALARAIGKIRPELDVYLIVDGAAEKVASHLDSKNIRRIFYGLEESEMDFHQVFETVKNAPDVFGIEMACHFFRCAIHDKINVQFRADLPDGSCESHSVIPWFQRTGLQRKMLLQISAQEGRIELGFEAEVVLDDHRLEISIHDHGQDAFFKTRHRDRFIYKRIFRTTKLPQFSASLAHLFRRGIVTDNQHLKVRFGEIARVKLILHQAIIPFLLSFLAHLPSIRGTAIRPRDDCLRDPVGDPREAGKITANQRILQRTHHCLPRIGAEGLHDTKRREQSLRGGERFLGGRPGGGLGDKSLCGMSQLLPAIATSLSGAKHANGRLGWGLGCSWRLGGHRYGVV